MARASRALAPSLHLEKQYVRVAFVSSGISRMGWIPSIKVVAQMRALMNKNFLEDFSGEVLLRCA